MMNSVLSFKQWTEDFEKEKKRLGLSDASPEFIYLNDLEREGGRDFLQETWKYFSEETFESLYQSYVCHFDLQDTLRELKIPVYTIFSSDDVLYPAAIARAIVPDHSGLEIHDAGHFPFLRQEGRRVIHDFLRLKLRPMSP